MITLIVEVTGESDEDLTAALANISQQIEDGFTSGGSQHPNANYTYQFNYVDDDWGMTPDNRRKSLGFNIAALGGDDE